MLKYLFTSKQKLKRICEKFNKIDVFINVFGNAFGSLCAAAAGCQ